MGRLQKNIRRWLWTLEMDSSAWEHLPFYPNLEMAMKKTRAVETTVEPHQQPEKSTKSTFGIATPDGERSMSKSVVLWQHELHLAAQLSETIAALRSIRDSKVYTNDGAHSFREWCMQQFGERIGGWLEEHL